MIKFLFNCYLTYALAAQALMLPLTPVTALGPLDGRYEKKVAMLREYFSEYALIKFRVQVEVEWLIALSQEPGIVECAPLSVSSIAELRAREDLSDAGNVHDEIRGE